MDQLTYAYVQIVDAPTPPDTSHLITEDDTPVDNLFSEKQQRLLTRSLYSSWAGPGEERPFLAAANVGVYFSVRRPAIVPDVFLSLDVQMPESWWETAGRSYLVWEMGKPPDVAIEIVSNTKGGETGPKLQEYARASVAYYVIFDPDLRVQAQMLIVYRLEGGAYVQIEEQWLAQVQLGLTLWEGEFEGRRTVWLRWCDWEGQLILTGQERAERERTRTEQERARADQERMRADQERMRAERLAAQLRAAGIEPELT